MATKLQLTNISYNINNNNLINRYSALGPVWIETRAQSGDWYGFGALQPGQVLRGSLPLLSPKIYHIISYVFTPSFYT